VIAESLKNAVLVGVETKRDINFAASMEELESLVESLGVKASCSMVQSREKPHYATYLGRGKVEELKKLVAELESDMVVCNDELSSAQLRNLEKELGVKVIDRTMVILEIFSRRARSREGMLQVELATLKYRLGHLTGKGVAMSRLGGGIGTRGAGEQKLEMDRRYIRNRIREIEKQMAKVKKNRVLHRQQRQKAGLKTVSLVGYTNAGKSSLFNALCQVGHKSKAEQVSAHDQLFHTLDTTTRRIRVKPGLEILIADTVGFINKLPHHLIAAFRSTLEEAVEADLLLHVVDISQPDYLERISVVEKVLEGLGASREKILTVFNKADLIEDSEGLTNGGIYVSARTGFGIKSLLQKIGESLQ
jgi:GTP-binding protein HflX